MGAENGHLPSSIPPGAEGDALRAEAVQYPSWRAAHMYAGQTALPSQVEVSPVLVRPTGVAYTEGDLGQAVAEAAEAHSAQAGST